MTPRYLLMCFVTVCLALPGFALPPEVKASLTQPERLGSTETKFAQIKIYQAELYVPQGMQFDLNREFALSLTYNWNFSAETLANASVVEMARFENRNPSALDTLKAKLARCFGDVAAGDRITGHALGPDHVRFYRNGKRQCDLRDANIRQRFFKIWLGPETRDKKGRARLIAHQG